MTARLLLANIGAFALQVIVVTAAGAVLARVLRIDHPRARLAYWRTLLAVCLALPLCQPWTMSDPAAVTTAALVVTDAPMAGGAAVALSTAAGRSWTNVELWLFLLVAGVGVRALWLSVGVLSLRRLRRTALPLDPVPAPVKSAQDRIKARARLFVSDRVSGPITFGFFKPVVMFPPNVRELAGHVQEAMACHELLHVRRRDWLSEIAEEGVRTVLWFHPAVWWLIGQVRLAREQVVDRAVIQLTDSRERYVEALLAVARVHTPPAFSPVSPFFRRHLLKQRVASILQESTMTTRRLIASLGVSALAVTFAAVFATRSFPLEAQARVPASNGAPIQITKGGEHLLHGDTPEYPRRAIEQKVEGDVVVDLTLDAKGEVSDARVLSGPEELRRATLESVLQWHYAPAALSSMTTQAVLRYHLPPAAQTRAELKEDEVKAYEVKGRPVTPGEAATYTVKLRQDPTVASREHVLREIEQAIENPSTPDAERAELKAKHKDMARMVAKLHAERESPVEVAPEERELKFKVAAEREIKASGPARLAQIRSERVSEATLKEFMAQAGVAVGDTITEETSKRLRSVAAEMDEHFRVELGADGKGGIVLTLITR